MGKGAQRHFFTILPAEGTIGPYWRQVALKLGGFADLQETHTGIPRVSSEGHRPVLRWQEMPATSQACFITHIMSPCSRGPDLPHLRKGNGGSCSLSSSLPAPRWFSSPLYIHIPAEKQIENGCFVSALHIVCPYKPCLDLPSQAQSPCWLCFPPTTQEAS